MQKLSILAFTLVLLALFQLSTQKTFPRLPLEVLQVMGSRPMRYHHFLWHNLRELWPLIDPDTQAAIAKLGWAPPRPSLWYDADENSHANETNDSGEDFLYMHQQMVNETNAILADVNGTYKQIVGFPHFPYPNDTDYPVPCNYSIGPGQEAFTELVVGMKSDYFYYNTVAPAEQEILDPKVLQNLTLGQLGSRLEYTLHQWLHLRFSKKTPYGIRVPVWNPAPNIDTKWDDLTYQWLADTYGSHVNPIFWRIHGWVNNRLEDWRKANNYTDIPWNNPWVGGGTDNLTDLFAVALKSNLTKRDEPIEGDRLLMEDMEDMDHMNERMETMEQVIQLFYKATNCKESPVYREVKVSPWNFEIEREKERENRR